MASFDAIDQNGDQKLNAAEIAPHVMQMFSGIQESHAPPMTLEQCM